MYYLVLHSYIFVLQLRQSGLVGGKGVLEIRGFHVWYGDSFLLDCILEREYTETEDNQESSETTAD